MNSKSSEIVLYKNFARCCFNWFGAVIDLKN